jgi:hypothetical protein
MNHAYRLVWNHAIEAFVPAPETARARGKSSGRGAVLVMLTTAAVLGAGMAHAGPTGGEVSTGSGNIAQSDSITTITQASQNLAINWASFSVASGERVSFVQPAIEIDDVEMHAPKLPKAALASSPDGYDACRAEARRMRAAGAKRIVAPSAALAPGEGAGFHVGAAGQFAIDWAVQPNSSASCAGVRPARTSLPRWLSSGMKHPVIQLECA